MGALEYPEKQQDKTKTVTFTLLSHYATKSCFLSLCCGTLSFFSVFLYLNILSSNFRPPIIRLPKIDCPHYFIKKVFFYVLCSQGPGLNWVSSKTNILYIKGDEQANVTSRSCHWPSPLKGSPHGYGMSTDR